MAKLREDLMSHKSAYRENQIQVQQDLSHKADREELN